MLNKLQYDTLLGILTCGLPISLEIPDVCWIGHSPQNRQEGKKFWEVEIPPYVVGNDIVFYSAEELMEYINNQVNF